jgi:hypothetical protein
MTATRANALRDYLGARRQQVRPEDVGLVSAAWRRVPGLHREELAMLAGVSAEHYLRLEVAAARFRPPRKGVRRSTDCFPKAGEGRCAPSRILQHPPVPQPVEHFGLGSGSFGGSTPDRL